MTEDRKIAGYFKEALTEDQLGEIDSRLLEGEGAFKIATWIQEEVGVLTDHKTQSLKKALERYRAKDLRRRTIERVSKAHHGTTLPKVHGKLNALENMIGLVENQQQRVGKLLKREADLPNGMLIGDTKNEMRLLKDMLVDLGKLQLETGVLKRAPKTVTGSFTQNGEEVAFSWTEEQDRLYKQLEHGLIEGVAHVIDQG